MSDLPKGHESGPFSGTESRRLGPKNAIELHQKAKMPTTCRLQRQFCGCNRRNRADTCRYLLDMMVAGDNIAAEMAKLGQNEFPEVSLSDSIELARRIYDNIGVEVRRDGLAIVLGMSPAGGAFGARVGALRMWGLATGRSLIRLSDDAMKIVEPSETDDEVGVTRKLAQSIPLFNELHARIDDQNVDQNVLAVLLQEITGATLDDVTRRIAVVERIYADTRSNFHLAENMDQSASSDVGTADGVPSVMELPIPKGWVEFRYDDGTLRMRETVGNLDILIGTLVARRNRMTENDD